jgi:predicted nucleotidyltransferase
MDINLPNGLNVNIEELLVRVSRWARSNPDIEAVALVGSQARNEASPTSDIDLMLLCRNPVSYLGNHEWITLFGRPARIEKEDWGKVTSLRVWYTEGLEVEFGIASDDWGTDPSDRGDGQVIRNGLIVLHEIDRKLSERVKRFGKSAGMDEVHGAGERRAAP